MNILYLSLILLVISTLEFFNKKNIFYFFIATILIYFHIGLSYKLGVDWIEYYSLYENISNYENYEIGFSWLSKFFSYININFWVFVFAIKFIFLTSLFALIKKYCLYPTTAITFILIFLFPFINDPLRQLIATSILFLGILMNKSKISYKNIIFGFLFHSSYILILFIKLQFIKRKQLVKISILFVFLSLLLIHNFHYLLLLGDNFIIKKIYFYLTYAVQPNIYSLFIRIIFLYFVCFNKHVDLINKKILTNSVYINFWMLSFLLLLVELLAFQFPLLSQRLRIYLSPFPFILFLNYIYFLKDIIFKSTLLLIVFLYLYATLFSFMSGPMGSFYSLENNIVIQFLLDFPPNDIEENIRNFWLTN
ncbi:MULTISPECIES: EpsG family protein [Proteus]|uniref:EpsG family protein n=1 Tax=Proteus TaxID=583 RepID=UPI0018C836C6|nr:EpsG family protein [Proteus mirabilis]